MGGIKRELAKYEKEKPHIFMDYVNGRGETLLMTACNLGHFGLIKYLICRYTKYKDAIFDTIDPSYGRSVSVLLLDFMGDYINYECSFGKSALIHALSCKHLCKINIAQLLLQSGASTKGNPEFGIKPPLQYAVEWRNYNLIELLLEYGADINGKNAAQLSLESKCWQSLMVIDRTLIPAEI